MEEIVGLKVHSIKSRKYNITFGDIRLGIRKGLSENTFEWNYEDWKTSEFRCYPKELKIDYILFDDGKSYLEFKEQNIFYHDYNNDAKIVKLIVNEFNWNILTTNNIYTDYKSKI